MTVKMKAEVTLSLEFNIGSDGAVTFVSAPTQRELADLVSAACPLEKRKEAYEESTKSRLGEGLVRIDNYGAVRYARLLKIGGAYVDLEFFGRNTRWSIKTGKRHGASYAPDRIDFDDLKQLRRRAEKKD